MRRKGRIAKDQFWVVLPDEINEIQLKRSAPLVVLRDEAHRFSVHLNRRSRKIYKKKSLLDEVQGVGSLTKKRLLKTFGSVAKLKEASFEDINSIIKNKSTTTNLMQALKERSTHQS